MTLLEVTIALAVVSTVLMASAGAIVSSLNGANDSQRRSRATVFLETVMEDLSVQSYDDLPAFNGNRIFDRTVAANSNYAVDVTVFLTAVDLQQIRAVLTDMRTNREIGRLTTLRTRR